jgi:hypothetical protein
MTIDCQIGDIDAHHHADPRPDQVARAEPRSIADDALAAPLFRARSAPGQETITEPGHPCGLVYEQANAHRQTVPNAVSNMASTDSAVGSSCA